MQINETTVPPSTLNWLNRYLESGERITTTTTLHGGLVAEMRKLSISRSHGTDRHLVLRSYTTPFALDNALDWLDRETRTLTLLAETPIPAPELVAVDPIATFSENPSLLMTHLPGRPVYADDGVEARIESLAQQLVAIHTVTADVRPRVYQSLTTADTVVIPARADRELWSAAINLIRNPSPRYDGRILHRDFQPGNVLFDTATTGPTTPRITGVVDWAGTSWGPADLDVAHCVTNLALLHGPCWGLRFAAEYEGAGGVLAASADDRRYWRVRDALACSEEVQLWAQPWRDAGRTDLTPDVVDGRLDSYVSILMRS